MLRQSCSTASSSERRNGACEQLGLAALAASPHRPDGVDHEFRLKIARGGNHRRAGGAALRDISASVSAMMLGPPRR